MGNLLYENLYDCGIEEKSNRQILNEFYGEQILCISHKLIKLRKL